MIKHITPFRQWDSSELQFIESVIETDALIEAHLTELESLLERKGDATLELAQLRRLRQSCERVKELIGKYEKVPVVGASASR
jgi:hypothetical protein